MKIKLISNQAVRMVPGIGQTLGKCYLLSPDTDFCLRVEGCFLPSIEVILEAGYVFQLGCPNAQVFILP